MIETCPAHGTHVALSHPGSTSPVTPLSAAAPGSIFSLSDFLQAQLVHRQVCDRASESCIFSVERFETLRLAHLHPTIRFAPAVIGFLADTELFTRPADVLALAQQHIRFTWLVDDRCGVISFRWHGSDLLFLPFYHFRSGPGIPGRVTIVDPQFAALLTVSFTAWAGPGGGFRPPVRRASSWLRTGLAEKKAVRLIDSVQASPFNCGILRGTFCDYIYIIINKSIIYTTEMAERVGFEPTKRVNVYTNSNRAPSTTRPPLRSRLTARRRLQQAIIRFKLGQCRNNPVARPGTAHLWASVAFASRRAE